MRFWLQTEWDGSDYLCGLAGEGPVEDACADLLAFDEVVGLQTVDYLLDTGEGNARLDRQLLDLLVIEDCLLNGARITVSWKILSIFSRFSS